MTEKLVSWTGDRWIISLSQNVGGKTLFEKKVEQKSSQLNEAKKDEEIKKILNIFDDANLVEIKENEE